MEERRNCPENGDVHESETSCDELRRDPGTDQDVKCNPLFNSKAKAR